MNFWTARSIQQITSGRWLVEPDGHVTVCGVCIDSRTIAPGQAFFAIRGERFDGHEFLQSAAQTGASILVASDHVKARSVAHSGVLLVADTLAALQQLAAAYRRELGQTGTHVIAVTGSNGKTTTRHLIHTVLSTRLRGTQSPKSFNNHIGVPLTLLGVRPDDDFVVVEMGTNHPGELDALSNLVRPDIGVITNIGLAHIGHFGTRESIAEEKSTLVRYVQPRGLAIVPCDEDWPTGVFHAPSGIDVIKFGHSASSDAQLSWVRRDQQGLRFSVNQSEPFRLPYLGEHNALNAIVAVLVGRKLGLHDQIIGRSLTVATAPPMRLQLIKLLPHHGIADRPLVVINDAYNANPESVLQALITLSNFPTPGPDGRRIAVLGDMFELGADAGAEHRHIGRALSQFESGPNCIHAVVLIGKLSACTAEELAPRWKDDRLRIFAEWDDSLPGKLAQFVGPGDVVLIKASRGMALERLIPALRATVEVA